MAGCFRCGEDMNVANGCTDERTITFDDGETVEPIAYGEESRSDGRPDQECHDCGAFPEQYHHPGCDMEICPRCGGQYFICDCRTDEKDEMWSQ